MTDLMVPGAATLPHHVCRVETEGRRAAAGVRAAALARGEHGGLRVEGAVAHLACGEMLPASLAGEEMHVAPDVPIDLPPAVALFTKVQQILLEAPARLRRMLCHNVSP